MEVFAHPTRPDCVVLRIAQCPRMFQMLTSAQFGHVMKHEPQWNGFVMTRTTYESMHKHLTHAASLLDFKQSTPQYTNGHPLPHHTTPFPYHEQPPRHPVTVVSVCTRSVWTQTEANLNTDGTQTEDIVVPPPPVVVVTESHPPLQATEEATLRNWKLEPPPPIMDHNSSYASRSNAASKQEKRSHSSGRMVASNPNAPSSASVGEGVPIESGLLRTVMPMFPEERRHTQHVPIDPDPVSSVHDTRQTVFSGYCNFQEVYAHREQMGLFLRGDR
jgi:hypothetical protein